MLDKVVPIKSPGKENSSTTLYKDKFLEFEVFDDKEGNPLFSIYMPDFIVHLSKDPFLALCEGARISKAIMDKKNPHEHHFVPLVINTSIARPDNGYLTIACGCGAFDQVPAFKVERSTNGTPS